MIEILAPAGDLISLKSAIASDTDAVYLGLSAFNARIKAENFTTENIKDTVEYCHLFGVKVFVTINIAVKESEKEELKNIIVACGQANVDAFIITDMSALELAKEFAPKVRLHASTQFGVSCTARCVLRFPENVLCRRSLTAAAETGAGACNRADCFTPKKRRESKAIFCRLPTYALPKI